MEDDDLLLTRTVVRRGTALVSLDGELDIATAPLVVDAVTRALQERPLRLDVSVAALAFCDVAGVRALLQARRVCRAHHSEFRLVGVRPRFLRVLALLRVTELLSSQPAPVGSRAGVLSSESP
ncbi:STAS domain-containing protein [Kitasatospora sp. NPDC048722]|uniref:STAS domain-containing protein n=1 Tax=Kitasatospora sp. NPDC048722 TaxID=3155639 RepID=UPI003405F6F6